MYITDDDDCKRMVINYGLLINERHDKVNKQKIITKNCDKFNDYFHCFRFDSNFLAALSEWSSRSAGVFVPTVSLQYFVINS